MSNSSASTSAIRRRIAQELTDAGFAIDDVDGEMHLGADGVDCEVVVTLHTVTPDAARVAVGLAAGGGDDGIRIHVAVFMDGEGEPTGTALVVSEATLADTLTAGPSGWQASVNPALSDAPVGPLDVCVAPLAEVGAWVHAELADWIDDDD